MTDHPRFEPVKGPPETAHRRYEGARLVDLVLRLVDRWRGSAGAAARAAPALDPSRGQIEIHERPPPHGPVAERTADELPPPHARLAGLFPDETFSRNFLLASARTRRLQAGLLTAFLTIVGKQVVQTLLSTRGQPHLTERSTMSAQGRVP